MKTKVNIIGIFSILNLIIALAFTTTVFSMGQPEDYIVNGILFSAIFIILPFAIRIEKTWSE